MRDRSGCLEICGWILSQHFSMLCSSISGRNEALLPISYEVFSSYPLQPIPDKTVIPWISVLQHSSLDPLLLTPGNVNRLEGERIQAGIIHGSGDGHRCGGEVLHLLGVHVVVAQILRQLDHIGNGAARMAGHEIGENILLPSRRLRSRAKPLPEVVQNPAGRLMHALRNRSGDMLRGDFEVAGDMVSAEVLQIA